MVYLDNIYWGLLIFPLIAAVFTLPYALYQYNKYGSVSKLRTLIIYSFILYMLIAFFMVCLPLPDWESTVGNRWQDDSGQQVAGSPEPDPVPANLAVLAEQTH